MKHQRLRLFVKVGYIFWFLQAQAYLVSKIGQLGLSQIVLNEPSEVAVFFNLLFEFQIWASINLLLMLPKIFSIFLIYGFYAVNSDIIGEPEVLNFWNSVYSSSQIHLEITALWLGLVTAVIVPVSIHLLLQGTEKVYLAIANRRANQTNH